MIYNDKKVAINKNTSSPNAERQKKQFTVDCSCSIIEFITSSNFFVISENALKIAFVDPETVTIRSGHDPSDMLIFAPD